MLPCCPCRCRAAPPSTRVRPLLALPACLPQLTDLWANDNRIGSLDEVEAALASQRATLSCVYLRGNPCAAGTDYKLRLKFALPLLQQLDDAPVA